MQSEKRVHLQQFGIIHLPNLDLIYIRDPERNKIMFVPFHLLKTYIGNPSLFIISFTLPPAGKRRWQPRFARAYIRAGRWVLPSFYFCQTVGVDLNHLWGPHNILEKEKKKLIVGPSDRARGMAERLEPVGFPKYIVHRRRAHTCAPRSMIDEVTRGVSMSTGMLPTTESTSIAKSWKIAESNQDLRCYWGSLDYMPFARCSGTEINEQNKVCSVLGRNLSSHRD
jgi:hypothetical protein